MDLSINKTARIGGVLYFVLIMVGMFSVLFVRGGMIVSGDVAATAQNIMRSPFLWRVGIVADLVMHLLDIPIMLIIFIILRPVNKYLALLALLFNISQTAVLVANKFNLIRALLLLESIDLKAMDPHQLYAQVYLSLKMHDIGFGTGLLFFGFTCLVNGYLISRSRFLPKTIGVLMQIAGVCYLVSNFTLLLAPVVSVRMFPFLMVPCLVAELSLCIWMIIKGVDVKSWDEKANVLQLGSV